MSSNVEIVSGCLERDVRRRGVVHQAARVPCTCGTYHYYSQRCGHEYKAVKLKCGATLSSITNNPIFCKAGRSRRVDIQNALVPFYCANCRRAGVRWAPEATAGQGEGHSSVQE
ncbi:hypothetical protein F4819DRAFT_490505 [Hypoxylon fuscum]|nr:hypothetical protein F4819DRAFT_490505 [Hypoxylon fuscum]